MPSRPRVFGCAAAVRPCRHARTPRPGAGAYRSRAARPVTAAPPWRASYTQSRLFHGTSPDLHEDNHSQKPAWTTEPPRPPSVHPHSSRSRAEAEIPLAEQLRALMRLVANSVVVCTSSPPLHSNPDSASAEPPLLGLTMSSFTSLSLGPPPLVAFNIAVPSRTEAAIAASRRFAVHVLAGDEAGAAVADVFRTGNADPRRLRRGLAGLGCDVACEPEQEPELDSSRSTSSSSSGSSSRDSVPFLRGPGVLYVLRCRLLDDEPLRGLVPVRDHVIVLGEVLEIVEGQPGAADADERFALVYADRHYRQLGVTMVRGPDADA